MCGPNHLSNPPVSYCTELREPAKGEGVTSGRVNPKFRPSCCQMTTGLLKMESSGIPFLNSFLLPLYHSSALQAKAPSVRAPINPASPNTPSAYPSLLQQQLCCKGSWRMKFYMFCLWIHLCISPRRLCICSHVFGFTISKKRKLVESQATVSSLGLRSSFKGVCVGHRWGFVVINLCT